MLLPLASSFSLRTRPTANNLLVGVGCGFPAWFPRLQLSQGTPAAHAGAQCSWLPSASRPELDTAQTACRHRLQGSSLALPKSVGKHRGIAADAVPRALETRAEISHFSQMSCYAYCYPFLSGEGGRNSLLGPKQLIPSPRESWALQCCWACGQVGTDHCSLLLIFVQLI